MVFHALLQSWHFQVIKHCFLESKKVRPGAITLCIEWFCLNSESKGGHDCVVSQWLLFRNSLTHLWDVWWKTEDVVLLDGIFRNPLCYSLQLTRNCFSWSHTRIWPNFSEPEPSPALAGSCAGPCSGSWASLVRKPGQEVRHPYSAQRSWLWWCLWRGSPHSLLLLFL